MKLDDEQKDMIIEYLRGYIIKDGGSRGERHLEIENEVQDFISRVKEIFGSDVYDDFIKFRKEKLYDVK